MSLSCFTENKPVLKECVLRRMRYLMGCLVQVDISCDDAKCGEAAIEAVFSEMKRVEKRLSRFLPESEVSKINTYAYQDPVKLSKEVFELIVKAVNFSEWTKGAFDLTSGSLSVLWQEAAKTGRLPGRKSLQNALRAVGSRYLRLNSSDYSIVFERPGMMLDFGAVGKGYAVDRAVQVLKAFGIQKALISTGSTLYCLNNRAENFGIVDPVHPEQLMRTVPVCNQALSTSASYERPVKIGFRTYSHIVNPLTGKPVAGPLKSVSIISESAMCSDMLSTTCYVLGVKKSVAMLSDTVFRQTKAVFASKYSFLRPLRILSF